MMITKMVFNMIKLNPKGLEKTNSDVYMRAKTIVLSCQCQIYCQ